MDGDFSDLFGFLGDIDDLIPGSLFECLTDVAFEIEESRKEDSDVLFLGSDGKRLVKCIHVPRSGLGAHGPVLFPGVSKHIIVAAYSDEFIQSLVNDIVMDYESDEEREQAWSRLISTLATHIAYIYDNEPPGSLAEEIGDI